MMAAMVQRGVVVSSIHFLPHHHHHHHHSLHHQQLIECVHSHDCHHHRQLLCVCVCHHSRFSFFSGCPAAVSCNPKQICFQQTAATVQPLTSMSAVISHQSAITNQASAVFTQQLFTFSSFFSSSFFSFSLPSSSLLPVINLLNDKRRLTDYTHTQSIRFSGEHIRAQHSTSSETAHY